ncbi:MAG: hypothetical protein WD648_14950 [Planctomycetaceae bacterium]
MAKWQINVVIIGALLAGISLAVAAFSAIERTFLGDRFSFAKLITTPWFAVGVVILIAVSVAYVVTQKHAAEIKRRIDDASGGLWQRPWWAAEKKWF